MSNLRFVTRRSTLAIVLLSLSGCAGVGLGQTIGGLGLPGRGSEVRGQVRYVDSRSRVIQLDSNRGNLSLDYDGRTQVVFGNRRYSPSSLERGDYVSARILRDGRRRAYADRIVVERSVRDSRGVYRDGRRGDDRGRYDDRNEVGRRQSFDGRIASIDYQRGYFQFEQSRGGRLTVAMPYNPRDADLRHFRRLGRGDRVRFDGTFLSRDRVELNRFR
jgi:hypothetical protein